MLAEIETDKATMELESYKNGTLLYQGAAKGEKIAVNDLLCIIGDAGKVNVEAIVAAAKGGVPAASNTAASAAAPAAPQAGDAAAEEVTAETAGTANGRVKASPLARRLAAEKGIDINKVSGSGDGGRIVKSDIDNYKAAAPAAASAAAPAAGFIQSTCRTSRTGELRRSTGIPNA